MFNWFKSKATQQKKFYGRQVATGKELIFISCINRDGSGVVDVSKEDMTWLNDTIFVLNSLSISNKTYIACEFNSYVVKLRKK